MKRRVSERAPAVTTTRVMLRLASRPRAASVGFSAAIVAWSQLQSMPNTRAGLIAVCRLAEFIHNTPVNVADEDAGERLQVELQRRVAVLIISVLGQPRSVYGG